MQKTKVLIINAMGSIQGDTAMLLLGLARLNPAAFHIYAVSIPRGTVYEYLRTLPHVTITPMELGGQELPPTRRLGSRQRILETALAIPRIIALAQRTQIDVIHTIDRTVGMTIAYIVSLLTGRPLLYEAHNAFYIGHSPQHRRVWRHATYLRVISQEMHDAFLPHVDDPRKIVIIPNAIEVSRYDPRQSGAAVRQEFGIPDAAQVVMLLGRINLWKGQRELIYAAELVLKKYPDTYFLIVGHSEDEAYFAKLQALIKELHVDHRFSFLGYRRDVPTVLAAANIATMPSYSEPFGLVALEAMAMEKPVIATRAGGVPEFMTDGETGLLIPPEDHIALADAILRLLSDPVQAQRLGERGRQHVLAHYSDQTYGAKIADLIKRTALRRTKATAP